MKIQTLTTPLTNQFLLQKLWILNIQQFPQINELIMEKDKKKATNLQVPILHRKLIGPTPNQLHSPSVDREGAEPRASGNSNRCSARDLIPTTSHWFLSLLSYICSQNPHESIKTQIITQSISKSAGEIRRRLETFCCGESGGVEIGDREVWQFWERNGIALPELGVCAVSRAFLISKNLEFGGLRFEGLDLHLFSRYTSTLTNYVADGILTNFFFWFFFSFLKTINTFKQNYRMI